MRANRRSVLANLHIALSIMIPLYIYSPSLSIFPAANNDFYYMLLMKRRGDMPVRQHMGVAPHQSAMLLAANLCP